MTVFTSIVAVLDGRVAKYKEFDDRALAVGHCEKFGGFVYDGAYSPDFYIENEQITAVPLVNPVLAQLDQYERDLDEFLDDQAKALTFKDRHSLALRAGYPNPWQALGQVFGTWMDACNVLAWEGRQAILAGDRTMPASKEEFLAELPAFEAPEQ